MITDLFLITIYGISYVLSAPIRSLSDVSVNSGLSSAISTITTYLYSINEFFPVNVLLIIIGIEVGIETGIFVYKFVMWVIKRLPTQS